MVTGRGDDETKRIQMIPKVQRSPTPSFGGRNNDHAEANKYYGDAARYNRFFLNVIHLVFWCGWIAMMIMKSLWTRKLLMIQHNVHWPVQSPVNQLLMIRISERMTFFAWLDVSWDGFFFQWHGSLLASSKSSESIVDDQDFWENEHFWLGSIWVEMILSVTWTALLKSALHFRAFSDLNTRLWPCYFRSTYIILCDSQGIGDALS